MRKIFVTLFLLAFALVLAPLTGEAQTAEPQTELPEAEKLAQIAIQLDELEQEVNRLTLLVTKLALEQQAADLQRQLAALMPQEESVAIAPMAAQPAESPPTSGEVAAGIQPGLEDIFAQQETDDNRASGFAAALGPLGNLGTPELAALLILAILAVFVLARRFRGRKEESRVNAPVSQSSPSPQSFSQQPQDLLDEGRQELKERVAWK